MRKPWWLCCLSLLGLCAWAGTGAADVVVRGPFGHNWVVVAPPAYGPGVVVQAPGVRVQVQEPPPLVVQPPPVVVQPPPVIVRPVQPPVIVQPPPVIVQPPPQPPVVVLPTRPLTHQEFANVFQPLPGTYTVALIHPGSRAPVNVTFTLPPGVPRVRVLHRALVFDYGRHEVEIHFAIHGKVRVTTR
jgi:hypothetical protein